MTSVVQLPRAAFPPQRLGMHRPAKDGCGPPCSPRGIDILSGANLPITSKGRSPVMLRGGTRTPTPSWTASGFKPPASAIPPPGPRGEATPPRSEASSVGRGRLRAAWCAVAVAASPSRPLACTTPSTMSPTTSARGRSRTLTATTVPPGSLRIVRTASERFGGVRNAGTSKPAARCPPRAPGQSGQTRRGSATPPAQHAPGL